MKQTEKSMVVCIIPRWCWWCLVDVHLFFSSLSVSCRTTPGEYKKSECKPERRPRSICTEDPNSTLNSVEAVVLNFDVKEESPHVNDPFIHSFVRSFVRSFGKENTCPSWLHTSQKIGLTPSYFRHTISSCLWYLEKWLYGACLKRTLRLTGRSKTIMSSSVNADIVCHACRPFSEDYIRNTTNCALKHD